jgi:hypothetical protein
MQFSEGKLAVQMEGEFELIPSPAVRTHSVFVSTTETVAANVLFASCGAKSVAADAIVRTTSALPSRWWAHVFDNVYLEEVS